MDNFSKTIGRTTPPDWRLEKIGRQTRKTGTRKESRQSISFWELHISHALLFSSISMFSRLPSTPQTQGAARCRTSKSAIHARGETRKPTSKTPIFPMPTLTLRQNLPMAFPIAIQHRRSGNGATGQIGVSLVILQTGVGENSHPGGADGDNFSKESDGQHRPLPFTHGNSGNCARRHHWTNPNPPHRTPPSARRIGVSLTRIATLRPRNSRAMSWRI